MIVIYHDVGGAHSTAVAANIHINRLPADSVPDKNAILSLPTFDKIQKYQYGRIIFIGEDEFGAKVYTLSRQRAPKIVVPALADLYNIINNITDNKGLYLVDTSSAVNTLMAIGGFLSRRVKVVAIARPIVTYGTMKAYRNIADIVKKVKNQIKEDSLNLNK